MVLQHSCFSLEDGEEAAEAAEAAEAFLWHLAKKIGKRGVLKFYYLGPYKNIKRIL